MITCMIIITMTCYALRLLMSVMHVMFHIFQLIILMALAKGKSEIRTGPLTLHTETAIHIAHLLTRVRQSNISRGVV